MQIKKRLIALFLVFMLVYAPIAISQIESDEGLLEEEQKEKYEEGYIEEIVAEEVIVEKAGITPDSPMYIVDDVAEDFQLAMKKGEEKAKFAMLISEEKVAEAKIMSDENKTSEVEEALTKATNISKIIEEEVSPDLKNETTENSEFIQKVLDEMDEEIPTDLEAIKSLIDKQKTQTEKNKIAVDIASKVGELCERLAMQDYALMEAEPRCNLEEAPDWLRDLIEDEIKKREDEALKNIQEELTSCVMDPRTCDCSKIPIKKHQLDCEKGTALAIRCEFEEDFEACNELEEIGPPEFENLPPFIRDVLTTTMEELIEKKEKEMFDKFAPPECKEAGALDRESCEVIMEEKYGPPPDECMKNGRFIGAKKCEAIMMEKHPIPAECVEDGKFIGRDECEQLMVEKYNIPEECKGADGHLLPEEECKKIMEEKGLIGGEGEAPAECMKEGKFIGREECEALMKERGGGEGREIIMPPECKDLSEEECEKLLKERIILPVLPEEGMPPECEGLSKEECMKIMERKGFEKTMGEIKPGLVSDISKIGGLENMGGYEFGNPEKVTVIGENGAESIPKDEIEKIKEEAIEKSKEEIEISEETRELSKKIEQLEDVKESESFEEIKEKIEEIKEESRKEEISKEESERETKEEEYEEIREPEPEETEEQEITTEIE